MSAVLLVFLKAIIVGLGASIPLGPLGVLCIQKTLSKGRIHGFLTGLGASVSDTIFSAISIMGIYFINSFLENNKVLVLFIGGFIIVLIGVRIYFANPIRQIRQKDASGRMVQDFFEGLLMTITNPGSLFLIFAMFAMVRLNISDVPVNNEHIVTYVVLWGIFIGSAFWWFSLSTLISTFRKRFRLRQLIVMNKIAGIVIFALGIISMSEGLVKLFMK